MITLDYDGQQLVITGAELDRVAVKTINGVEAAGARRWVLPATVPTYTDAEIVVNYEGGEITAAAQEWWASIQEVAQKIIALKDNEFPSAVMGEITLRKEQEADAQFLSQVGSGLILNDMRTGKTYTLFRTVQLLDAFPLLVATLPNTTFEIARQARMAFPDKTVGVISKGMTAPQRKKLIAEKPDILILGHNLLTLHSKVAQWGGLHKKRKGQDKTISELEREKGLYETKELNGYGFKAVAVDEGHAIEKPESQITRAAWEMGGEAARRFVLTGTPAANHEDEFWGLLKFTYPKLFPAKGKWLDRYINMPKNNYGIKECRSVNTVGNDGVKRDTAIRPEVRKEWGFVFDLMHVRRIRTAGPEKEYRVIPVELPKAQLKAYRQLAEHSMAEIGDDVVMAADSMSLRHRLGQFSGGTPVLKDGNIVALEMPSAKIEAMLDVLAENDGKAIVVCESRLLADLVLEVMDEQKIHTVAILGGMSQESQNDSEREFQTGSAKVILINKAGAFGKELSAASRTIFLERSFDYKFSSQAEARNTSQAQEAETVEVIDIFAKGTLDEAVREAFLRKDTNMHERLRDKEWVRQSMYGTEEA